MKTNFTHVLIIRIILFILICLYSILVFGQTDDSKSAANKTNFGSHVIANYTLNNRHIYINKSADDVLTNVLRGDINDGQVRLRWSFATDNNISTVILERGHAPGSFRDLAIFWLNFDGRHKSDFKYTDPRGRKRSAYYRLKIVAADREVSYSNVLHFIGKKQKENHAEVSQK